MAMTRFAILAATAGALACATPAAAAVQLPSFFSDHMVLQRDLPIAVWGSAAPGEAVTVQLGDQAAVAATSAADGSWKARLPASKAGGPYALVVKGGNEVRVADVLIGEVWLCSGQSNMEFTVDGVENAAQEKAAATDPAIRQLWVPRRPASQPEASMEARWTVGSPASVGGFTACGYFMARQLRKQLDVPVGLINASWGGTRIEPWTPASGFAGFPLLSDIVQQLKSLDPADAVYKRKLGEHLDQVEAWAKQAREALATGKNVPTTPTLSADLTPLAERKDPQQQPTTLYNGMIHALVGYGMRGAIWYQGESNHGEGLLYTEKMKALIGGWRQVWGIGDFPFYYVQIAPFQYGEDLSVLPSFWVAQSAALAIPNTGMVVTNDIGTLTDIHPRNKQEVGRRLALLALAKTYGKTALVCEGPTFKAVANEGAKLRVNFTNAAGLTTRDGKPPTWFEVMGEDTDFIKADAAIDGESVVLSSAQVAKPIAMRFAWSRDAEPNLVNGAGLPTAAFVGGGVPYVDLLGKIAEAKDYQLAYAIDLAHLGANPVYDTDNSASLTKPFTRIAYFLELQLEGRPVKYAWTSMDAFTTDIHKITIPVIATGATFQQSIRNLSVASNVTGISTGAFPDAGNIEFWPNNYGPANGAGVANASDAVFDFGDQIGEPKDGYGCMQVHNHAAQQTIFAINNFKAGAAADIGIGNSAGETRDWTFKANASSYRVKKLRIFVLPKP